MAASKEESGASVGKRKYRVKFRLRQAELQQNDLLAQKYKRLLELSGEEFDKEADLMSDLMDVDKLDETTDQIGLSGDIATPVVQNGKIQGYTDKDGNMCRIASHGTLVDTTGKTMGYADKDGRVGFLGQNGHDIYNIKGELVAYLYDDKVIRNVHGEVVQLAETDEDKKDIHDAKGSKGSKGSKDKTNKNLKKKKAKSVRIKSEPEEGNLFMPRHNSSESDSTEGSQESDSAESNSGDSDSGKAKSRVTDPEYGAALFARGTLLGNDAETVGYYGSRRSIGYVNRYGPKRYAIYRLQNVAHSEEYENKAEEGRGDVTDVSNPANRFGDETVPGMKKLKYTKRHIKGIYGVAWQGDGSKHDLDIINPEIDKSKWPTTYVLVDWNIEGKSMKRWETRQAIRARWGKDFADRSIFEAACEAQTRYEKHIGVPRSESYSRSPSVGLITRTVEKERQKSLGADRARSRSTVATTHSTRRRQSPSSETDTDDLTTAFERFQITYYRMYGVNNFDDLSRKQKADCVLCWQEEEDRLRGEA